MNSSLSSNSYSESFHSLTPSSSFAYSSMSLFKEVEQSNLFISNIKSFYQSKDQVMSLTSFPDYANDLLLNETLSETNDIPDIYIESLFHVCKLEKM